MANLIFTLEIFWGSFFAQFLFTDQGSDRRELIYLPRQPLKNHLPKFLNPKQNEILIYNSFLRRLFHLRLGGSVAQWVPPGFETWLESTQKPLQKNLLGGIPSSAIASKDLIFPVLKDSATWKDLQPSLQILREKGIGKICLQVFGNNKPPWLAELLAQDSLDIFCHLLDENENISTPEVQCPSTEAKWRANVLNASFLGSFQEQTQEISDALKEPQTESKKMRVHWIDNHGHKSTNMKNPMKGLFSFHGRMPANHFHLGLEEFIWFNGQESFQSVWKSHWGPVALNFRNHHYLHFQPTSVVLLNELLQVSTGTEQGYEPGPVLLGRGQIPQLCDFLFFLLTKTSPLPGPLGEWIQERQFEKLQKLVDSMMRSQGLPSENIEDLGQRLINDLGRQMILLKLADQSATPELSLSGFFAPLFLPFLRRHFPHTKILTELPW